MAKQIIVKDSTHQKLQEIKFNEKYKSIDKIIDDMLFQRMIKDAVNDTSTKEAQT